MLIAIVIFGLQMVDGRLQSQKSFVPWGADFQTQIQHKFQTDFNVDKVNFKTSMKDKFQTNFDQLNFQTSLQDQYQTKLDDKVQNANQDGQPILGYVKSAV